MRCYTISQISYVSLYFRETEPNIVKKPCVMYIIDFLIFDAFVTQNYNNLKHQLLKTNQTCLTA